MCSVTLPGTDSFEFLWLLDAQKDECPAPERQDGKKPATSVLVKTSRAQPEVLHVVLVIDGSLSMGTEDIEVMQSKKGSQMKLPANIRRIDAVFNSCRAFLETHQDASGLGTDLFSLVVFNSRADVVFQRQAKKYADGQLKKLAGKLSPKHETKFQSAFRAVEKLIGLQQVAEDVRVILLSDGKPYEKYTVRQLFEKHLLNTASVQMARSFEVHAVGFGPEPEHWTNLRHLAEMTRGTFQQSSLDQLALREAFTSIAATITVTTVAGWKLMNYSKGLSVLVLSSKALL